MHHVPLVGGGASRAGAASTVIAAQSPSREGPEVPTTIARERSGDPRLVRVQDMSLRRWLATTPGRLRASSVLILIGLLLVGVVAATAASARGNAARAVGLEAAPELVAAEDLYGSLADADATASIIFLKAGRESTALRNRYERDLREAGNHLAALAQEVGSAPQEHTALATIANQLPIYSGLVDTARANGRLGFPVGEAYLKKASSLLRDEMLPAATTLYEHAATRLDDEYNSGTSTTEIVLVVVAGLAVLALLAGVQLFVTRRSNRILNVGLVGATVLVAIMLGWTLGRFVSAQNSLVDAQRKGSDAVQLLSAARILTLQAQADENTTLIERGGGDAFVRDFNRVMHRLGGADGRAGLLGEARAVAARTGSAARLDPITADFVALREMHREIREIDDVQANYGAAVDKATGPEAALIRRLDNELSLQIGSAEQRLDDHATDARGGFDALTVAIPLLLVLAGVLALVGLQRRITEYR
jgi:hypothetical protein